MSSNIPEKVLLRWIGSSLQYNGMESKISSLDDLRDGIVLSQLTQTLVPEKKLKVSLKPSTQKMVVLGRLQTLLDFIAEQNVRVTCSPDEIYDGNENMILGLVWVLILHFQVVRKKEVMDWIKEVTNKYLASQNLPLIQKVEKSFQNGSMFCSLINAIQPNAIDVKKIGSEEELTETAFQHGEKMGIPIVLDVGDTYDDKSLLLYLSYYYNKFKNNDFEPPPPSPPPQDDGKLEELLAKITELEKNVQERDLALEKANNTITEMSIKAEKELGELQESQSSLEKELEETKKENEIVEKKVKELTLKMPFFLKNEQSTSPPPEGEVTLVFTDVQSSTLQWEHRPDAMAASLAIHNQMMRELIKKHNGYEVKTEGDAFMIAFSSPVNAVRWCLETQQELLKQEWPEEIYEGDDSAIEEVDGVEIYRGLRVRMGVHFGEPSAERDPVTGRMDYFGPMVNRSARVEGTAAGGQIVISGEVYENIKEAIEQSEIEEVELKDMGQHRLKGLQADTQLYQILPVSLTKRSFPEYGVKPEEENEQKDFQAEMDELVKENEELKEKMSSLEAEAQEALEKAAVLSKWLEEIQKDLPPSLGKELLSATKNIGQLIKSHSEITIAIQRARQDGEKSLSNLQKTKKKLRKSERKGRELRSIVEDKSLQIQELEEHIQMLETKWESRASHKIKRFISKGFSSEEKKEARKTATRSESVPSNEALVRRRSISDSNLPKPKKRRRSKKGSKVTPRKLESAENDKRSADKTGDDKRSDDKTEKNEENESSPPKTTTEVEREKAKRQQTM